MTFSELNKQIRDLQDQVERVHQLDLWLKNNTQQNFSSLSQQPTSEPDTTSLEKISQLTPEQIKEQYALRGEEFLNETIQQLDKQFPGQVHENQTKKLPSPPLPKNHEEMLKMFKKDDSIDSIILRFQGEK